MADKKLEYWYDWRIHDPEGNMLINLVKSPPSFDKKKINNVDYLCKRIKDYPDSILLNKEFWNEVVMLRQKAFKDEGAANELKKICKAILGDGRKRKKRDYINDLIAMIKADITFFKEIREEISGENISVDYAITRKVDKAKNEDQKSNYETVYYEYIKVYELLKKKLTDKEIFCFFYNAAEHIDKTNVTLYEEHDGKLLTFVKMKTWYVRGSDMHV